MLDKVMTVIANDWPVDLAPLQMDGDVADLSTQQSTSRLCLGSSLDEVATSNDCPANWAPSRMERDIADLSAQQSISRLCLASSLDKVTAVIANKWPVDLSPSQMDLDIAKLSAPRSLLGTKSSVLDQLDFFPLKGANMIGRWLYLVAESNRGRLELFPSGSDSDTKGSTFCPQHLQVSLSMSA